MAISILSLLGFKWIGQAMNGIHGHPIPSPRLHPSEEACGHFITLRVIQQFSKTQTSMIRVFFFRKNTCCYDSPM